MRDTQIGLFVVLIISTGGCEASDASSDGDGNEALSADRNPTELAATAQGTTIRLTWRDRSSGEQGFAIERALGSTFVEIARTPRNAVSYVDPNLLPTTTYSYRIRAFADAVYTYYSNTVTATTQDGATPANCPQLSAPLFYAYQSGATRVELVLSSGKLQSIDHYEIHRQRIDVAGPPVALSPKKLSAATSSITDAQGLVSGGVYSYSATLVQADGTLVTVPLSQSVDAGVSPPQPLGTSISLGHIFGGYNWGGPFNDLQSGAQFFDGFPAPIGRTYAKYLGTARDPVSNAALPCASVQVINASTGAPATLFADRYGKFPYPNPTTTDRHGRFELYVENGTYDLLVSGPATYSLTGMTISDPRTPQIAHVGSEAAALRLVTDVSPVTGDGNIALKFIRPNSPAGPMFWNLPHRLFVNDSINAWAMTYNAAWDEPSASWTLDHNTDPAFVLRINKQTQALEYLFDGSTGPVDGPTWAPRAPHFETLLHVGPDRAHFKSLLNPVGIAATAGESGIFAGRLVHYNADGTVGTTTAVRELHPFVVLAVDALDGTSLVGSQLYLAVAGSVSVFAPGNFSIGDPVISAPAGAAQVSPGETDSRYVVGYSQTQGANFMTMGVR